MKELYAKDLAKQWSKWVETSDPKGTREHDIFPVIKKWLTKSKPIVLVDIGCGQGSCSSLVNRTVSYVGIDASTYLISRAKKLYSEKSKVFLKGDLYDLPVGDSSVDAALSMWVWSHVADLPKAAAEMSRILRSGGKFLIITASPSTYALRKTFYSKFKIKGNLLTGDFDLGNGRTLSNTTLYLHTEKQILFAIKKAGLTITKNYQLGLIGKGSKGLYIVLEGRK